MSVCLCHRETPPSGGRVDLWSKIAFLILVWDDTFSKKKGGPIFWRNFFGGGRNFFFGRVWGGVQKPGEKKIWPPPPKFFFFGPSSKKIFWKIFFFGEIFLRAILEGGPKSRVKKFRQKIGPPVFLKIVSSQTNIRNAIFDQRSTRPPEGGVSRWHRHTDGHGDSMTNSAQWGRVGENGDRGTKP